MIEGDRFDELMDLITMHAEGLRADIRKIAEMQAAMLRTLQEMQVQQLEMREGIRRFAEEGRS